MAAYGFPWIRLENENFDETADRDDEVWTQFYPLLDK